VKGRVGPKKHGSRKSNQGFSDYPSVEASKTSIPS